MNCFVENARINRFLLSFQYSIFTVSYIFKYKHNTSNEFINSPIFETEKEYKRINFFRSI